jgi:hypothetical protein
VSYDTINPPHYKHPSGFETILIEERLAFCPGSCFKYVTRAGKKPGTDPNEDYKKAAWFARRAAENGLPMVVDDNPEGVTDLITRWCAAEPDKFKVRIVEMLGAAVLTEAPSHRKAQLDILGMFLERRGAGEGV